MKPQGTDKLTRSKRKSISYVNRGKTVWDKRGNVQRLLRSCMEVEQICHVSLGSIATEVLLASDCCFIEQSGVLFSKNNIAAFGLPFTSSDFILDKR